MKKRIWRLFDRLGDWADWLFHPPAWIVRRRPCYVRVRRILPILVLAACLLSVAPARAGYPTYVILQSPTAKGGPQGHTPIHYPGRDHVVKTDAYAYGWFGARAYPQRSRSTGYYHIYTQWSKW